MEDIDAADPAHEYKEYRQKVKKYISLFRMHIFDIEHPINIINKSFTKEFSSYLKDKIHDIISQNLQENEVMQKASELEREVSNSIQKYIIKLQSSIRLMYARCMNYQCFLEERDDFINLVTSLVFNEDNLYKTIFQLFELTLISQKKIFEEKLRDFSNVTPEDLGIHDKFCLNERTLLLHETMLKKKQEKQEKEVIKSSISESDKDIDKNSKVEKKEHLNAIKGFTNEKQVQVSDPLELTNEKLESDEIEIKIKEAKNSGICQYNNNEEEILIK